MDEWEFVLQRLGPVSDAGCEAAKLFFVSGHSLFRCKAESCNAPNNKPRRNFMLYYAAVFFIIAIVAALFGFGGIAAGASSIAQVLFFIFVVLFLVSLIGGLLRRKG